MAKLKYSTLKEIVYTLIQLIPLGKVTSYGSLARIVGKNPRLIGKILSENKREVIIPCHRVVKADGNIGGYKGSKSFKNIMFKAKLLELENVSIKKKGSIIKVNRESFIDLEKILHLTCKESR